VVSAYDEPRGNALYYPQQSRDPVRPNMPYTPVQNVPPTTHGVPLLGVLIVAALILFLEHRRRRRGR
jgi:hypothetical protein